MAGVDDIMRKFGKEIEKQISTEEMPGDISQEYLKFKEEMMPALSKYEKNCRNLGSILKLNLAEKDRVRIQKKLDLAHLDVTPSQVVTFSFVSSILLFFLGVLISLAIYFYSNIFPGLFLFLVLIATMFIFYYTYDAPERLANKWRLKASSQMVPCILYVVVYMKHTSNLERAIAFASKHLQVPLALDFKKIFWDVEIGRYSTIKESLDSYLSTWEKDSLEFVEAFHLIESSLFEPSEARRIQILEKSLQVMLDGVYEKMLSYSREVRAPLTNVYMLGIVLPTLALALLPLASTLLGGGIKWYHVFVLFNLIIPFFVFYLTNQIMLKRPGGYGESELLELNPLYYQYQDKKPYFTAFFVCLFFIIIGLIPFLFQVDWLTSALSMPSDFSFSVLGGRFAAFFGEMKFFDFKEVNGKITGPFGPLALLFSLFIPLGIALFFSIVYNAKTKNIIKARHETKQLENEFTNSLFMLGNRLGDGLPAEVAFGRIAESTTGQITQSFFRTVNLNIQQSGMSLEQAIFNPRRGAIIYYPSSLIATSMRILVESVKKGLKIAAESLMSISEYVKNIHKIEERLRDLLAEVVSDMKSNMTFLAPLLAGVVVGLAGMITLILNKLLILFDLGQGANIMGFDASQLQGFFNVKEMIPPYFLQIAIGIYIIEIIFILTGTLVTIDSGEDRLKRTADIGKNLKRGVLLYLIIALVSILALSILAMVALSGTNFG